MKPRPATTFAKTGAKSNFVQSLQNSPAILSLLLFLLALGVFLPTLKNDFVNLDDPLYVTKNVHVMQGLTWAGLSWAFHAIDGGIWLPLTWFSHMLDCQLYGPNAWGHHLTSVLLHAVNTALFFVWLRRLTGATWRSFVVASLFALHPLRVESVAWVAERKDVLSGLFWFLTLLAYTRFVEESKVQSPKSKVFYILALACFALGLMAKPMLVTLPFVLLLLDYWPLNRFQGNKSILPLAMEKLPFIFLSTLASLVAFAVQKHVGTIIALDRLSLSDRIKNAAVSYARYIGKLFWPENLSVFYPYGYWPLGMALLAAIMLAIISLILLWQRRRHPYLLVGWLWFLGTLVPVIGLAQVGEISMADRYTYIPQAGLLLGLVWGAYALTKSWKRQAFILSAIASGAIITCMILTNRQIAFWKNSEALFRHAIAVTGDNPIAHADLGNAFINLGRIDEAIIEYQKALEIYPNYAETYNALGNAFFAKGQFDKAIVQYQKALEINRNFLVAYYNLGSALRHTGRIDEAIVQYQTALAINPNQTEIQDNLNIAYAEKHFNSGLALFQAGKADEAIIEYQNALEIYPNFAEAYYGLGNVYFNSGQMNEAVTNYQKALTINPNLDQARNNLGNGLMKMGRVEEAIANYQKALAMNPNNVNAHNNLGTALLRTGRPDEAVTQYRLALEIQPDNADACSNLGLALFRLGRMEEALTTTQRALQLAVAQKNAALIDAIQRQIKLYQAGSSFRDAAQTNN